MPESPKFLMSRGRNDEALVVFQLIYKINHKNSEGENYPVSISKIFVITSEHQSYIFLDYFACK